MTHPEKGCTMSSRWRRGTWIYRPIPSYHFLALSMQCIAAAYDGMCTYRLCTDFHASSLSHTFTHWPTLSHTRCHACPLHITTYIFTHTVRTLNTTLSCVTRTCVCSCRCRSRFSRSTLQCTEEHRAGTYFRWKIWSLRTARLQVDRYDVNNALQETIPSLW